MRDLNIYIIRFRKPSGSKFYNVITQRTFKTLREARTDVRETIRRMQTMEKVSQWLSK